MNQPYDPQTPYGDRYGGGNESYGNGAGPQQHYGQPEYGQQPDHGRQGAYGQPAQGGYGFGHPAQPPSHSPQPPKSKVPIAIAAGLVAVLGIGVTLFLVLRDDSTTGGGGGGRPTAPEITAQFFQAVDDVDEDGMQAVARGDVLDDIEDIVDQGGTDVVTFTDGELIADRSKQTDDVEVAIVVWELDDPTESDSSIQLSVGLLDDGDGYKVCYIDDPSDDIGKGDDKAVDGLVDDWADEFAEHCDYSK
jgi:hypothetical protein